MTKITAMAISLLFAAAAPGSQADDLDRLVAAARADSLAWTRLEELCDLYPHRLSGSRGLEGAVRWGFSLLEGDGHKTWLQQVLVPHWERGEESLSMLSPAARDLPLLGLGGSVGTPGLEAPVLVVSSYADLGPQAAGRIVVYNVPMPQDGLAGYREVVGYRYRGAVEAARHGAVAALLRSITTRSLRTPHTGGTGWDDPDLAPIPYAAITVEDAEMLARLQDAGVEAVLRLEMGATTHADAISHNVIAEIPGTDLADEIVIVSGHLDAWDVGCGAHDDGVGVVQAMETLRLFADLGLRPRRTVRVVLWTNEENGRRGGDRYADTHGREGHVAAIESDAGAALPVAWSAEGTEEQLAWLAPMAQRLGLPLVFAGSGVDIGPLGEHGVLRIGLRPDDSRYFDFHHSPADTLDKVDPALFLEGLAQVAGLTWLLANADL
ncbi:M20/M25/M40 family metallo-hydrolase [bacterium]|nr:M20/M25/M40 family metallo-hydrolase [bacterium]